MGRATPAPDGENDMAQLTRQQMEAIIRGGGSVSIGGKVISRIDQLPSATELAGDNPEKLAATIEDLDSQIAALQAQKKQAQAAKKKAEEEAAKKAAEEAASQQAPT